MKFFLSFVNVSYESRNSSNDIIVQDVVNPQKWYWTAYASKLVTTGEYLLWKYLKYDNSDSIVDDLNYNVRPEVSLNYTNLVYSYHMILKCDKQIKIGRCPLI